MNTQTLTTEQNNELFNFWIHQIAGNRNQQRNLKGQKLAFAHWKNMILRRFGNFEIQLQIIANQTLKQDETLCKVSVAIKNE